MLPMSSKVVRYIVQLCVFARTSSALPLHNITLPLPIGTSNHATPGLLCTPTKWTDVALFYLFNYVAHAATVLTRPGERLDDFIVSVIGSLLFPALGLYRGIEAILSRAAFVKHDDLKKAARSGALCLVVRGKDWRPHHGDEVPNAVFRRAKKEPLVKQQASVRGSLSSRCGNACDRSVHVLTYSPPWLKSQFRTSVFVQRQTIHGSYELPNGYRFAIVPSDAQFTASASPNAISEVSATHNMIKALIALVQSCYALSTLYRSRGDQIEQFGYAAFGLTVAPYAVMSFVNLLGNLCRPDYASLYMVENSILDEARRRGGVFEGAVGRVREESTTVCGCGLPDADDAKNLQFSSNKDDELTTIFHTPALPEIWHSGREEEPQSPEKAVSVCSSIFTHSHNVNALPPKLNYTGTEDDSFLIIPCCNPIMRGSAAPSYKNVLPPQLYRFSSISLSKPCWPFKHRDWTVKLTCSTPSHSLRLQIIKYLITTVVALTPLALYGGMCRFQAGSIPLEESSTWRAYTVQWLVLGAICGIWWVVDQESKDARLNHAWQFGPLVRACVYVVSANPAVGGFVVVAQMLMRYGVCIWVGD
ncbi:hypothetical protein P171DRAFT_273004 [Karstenula rhodostoma CBS 690.94]|uniref:Uncharacterized protein n=1 Tax=Karstenula rhodostoma CBS 690.94 TaxID=1392251 RepID=A0A9P4PKC2_9PLEO|nr:hypothetical protein P171DRAFT_273004 [Karstenula rhodostoma CBS 690.94]